MATARNSKIVYLWIFIVLCSLTTLCIAGGFGLSAYNSIPNSIIIADDVDVFHLSGAKFLLLSTDGARSSITLFDSSSKSCTSLLDLNFSYKGCAFREGYLYLAENITPFPTTNPSNQILLSKYYLSSKNQLKLSESLYIKSANILNKSAFTVGEDEKIFYIDAFAQDHINVYSALDYSSAKIEKDGKTFVDLTLNPSSGSIYARSTANNLVKIDTKSYNCSIFSCTLGDGYTLLDNELIYYNGCVYKINTSSQKLDKKYDSGGKFTNAAIGPALGKSYIFCKTGQNTITCIDKATMSATHTISLEGSISHFFASGECFGVITAINSANYIKIISDSDLIAIPPPPKDPDDIAPPAPDNGEMDGDSGTNSDPGDTNNKPSDEETPVGEITSKVYDIDAEKGIIFGVDTGTTVSAFKKNLEYPGYDISFTNYDGKSVTSGNLGTGAKVSFSRDETAVHEWVIIVTGDVTGEGNINSRDLTTVKNHLLCGSPLDETALLAADINRDGVVNTLDLFLLRRMFEK